jgi:hypothetical protein
MTRLPRIKSFPTADPWRRLLRSSALARSDHKESEERNQESGGVMAQAKVVERISYTIINGARRVLEADL